jgi:hypothetical protein
MTPPSALSLVDEVLNIRDKAEALRAYARQAKNKQGEIDFSEIRIRAVRRIGQMMAEQPKAKGGSLIRLQGPNPTR